MKNDIVWLSCDHDSVLFSGQTGDLCEVTIAIKQEPKNRDYRKAIETAVKSGIANLDIQGNPLM